MRRKRLGQLVPLLVCGAVAATAASATASSAPRPRPPTAACANERVLGLEAPLTGDVGALGREQRNWARLAVARYNAAHATSFRLVEEDTQLDPARAAADAQQLADNRAVLAVVGPAGSDEVPAVGPVLARAKLGYVSGSATRATLTDGSFPGFFRVVPGGQVQAPTDARFILSTLRAKRVLVVDDGSAYSLPLADDVQRALRTYGVVVTRDSVPTGQPFGPSIAKVGRSTAVFLPWQSPTRAERYAQQLRARVKHVAVVGADALFSADFALEGGYVSFFAPDVRRVRAATGLVRDYTKRFGARWSAFGAPTYVATQAAMGAVDRACANGSATRLEVRAALAKTHLATSALGIPISFTAHGDLKRSRFWVYRVVNGAFRLVQ